MTPRERLLTSGPGSLAELELLAVLLGGGGTGGTSQTQVSAGLLDDLGSLEGLAEAAPDALLSHRGMGPARAARVLAALELARRLGPGQRCRGASYSGPEDVYRDFSARACRARQERFWVVLVDRRHRKLSEHLVSLGSLTATMAEPREVFGPAVRASAAAVILVHNHPSGDATPSAADCRLTVQLARAGRLLGIPVLDHVVVGDGAYASLRAFCSGEPSAGSPPCPVPEPVPVSAVVASRASGSVPSGDGERPRGWQPKPALLP